MTTDTTGGAASPRVHNSTIYAGAVLLVLVVAGTLVLSVMGWDSQRIAGVWATAAAGAAVLLPILNRLTSLFQETQAQTQALAKIDHQTNGVLRDKIGAEIDAAIPRIVTAVRAAWDEPVPYAVTDPTPPAPPATSWADARHRVAGDEGDPLHSVA